MSSVISSIGSSSCDMSEEKGPLVGMRVLIVDDDIVSLQVVCTMLEQCGYIATSCTSGTEGMETLRQNEGEIDIVLTDVHMPDMDGFEFLEKIGLEMDLPVVMLSVDSSHETLTKGLMHGACDYLLKPVQMEELAKIGEHVLTWRKANASMDTGSMEDDRTEDDLDFDDDDDDDDVDFDFDFDDDDNDDGDD